MILILTDPGIGGTFLTWTLHYLAGHTEYFRVESNSWQELTSEPLTDLNAHGFLPNYAASISELVVQTDRLKNTKTDNFHTFYIHNLTDQQDYTTSSHCPTVSAIKEISALFSKVILLDNSHDMYNISSRSRSIKINNTDLSNKEHFKLIDDFFKDSYDRWIDQGLTHVWDHREFLALNIRPAVRPKIKFNVDPSIKYYHIDSFDFYNIFDINIDHLFSYLDVEINQSRRDHWTTVYQKWRKLHTNRMQFAWYFNTIIDAIINDIDLDLTRFDLDIMQEACIQHSLIYDHNLNLKTWQLDKFTNTKQLHQLLEPNQHKLLEY